MASACPEEICLSRWMSRLLEGSPRASTVPLCRLWIPGTHDSGTWDLHGGSKAAFDTVGLEKSNFLSKLLELIGKVPFASRMTNAIVANLSKTQSFDVAKQLDLGIRCALAHASNVDTWRSI